MSRRVLACVVLLSLVLVGRPASAALSDVSVTLAVVESLTDPIAMATRPLPDTDLYIAQKGGTVEKWDGVSNSEVLDISSEISTGSEQGLLGLAFSPTGDALFVDFTNTSGDTIVRRYDFTAGAVVLASKKKIIEIDQPFSNHNGGNLAFGPDGHLYIGMGDGGDANDPGNRAQDTSTLLGKMLRIDPLAAGGYTIPAGNPWVGHDGADEIWAKGLRNPWRYSFDKFTGDLWIADVGQDLWEEVDFQAAASTGKQNYGWRRMEGTHVHNGTVPPNHVPPVFEYKHKNGNCAITGGYVYRGSAIADLAGAYVYGDYCTGKVKAFLPSDPAGTNQQIGIDLDDFTLGSFGQDNAGELYVLSLDGPVYRIDPGV